MSSSFGKIFCVTTWGESHGPGVGCVIDGCPPGINISIDRIQEALDRRRPGQSRLTTPRDEKDTVQLLSGVFEGITQGTPISLVVSNGNVDSSKYESLKTTFRPSHADFTYQEKYGRRDWRGGGRASARETVARVASGAIAEMLLEQLAPIEIVAWVDSLEDIYCQADTALLKRTDVDSNDIRCPDQHAAEKMIARIQEARREKDTVGGCIRCLVRGIPPGWGEPVFDKLTATLAGAMMSIPATRGFEIGSGFSSTNMRGSTHNDPFVSEGGRIRTKTNHSGGIQGGISNGEDIWFRVAFKPVATIFQPQETVDASGKTVELTMKGRHDPCVLPRAVPIVESMCALTLADAALMHNASAGLRFPR